MATDVTKGGQETARDLLLAAVAGITAGIVFGIMIQFVLERMTAIGALYTLGEPSASVGWVAHLGHSALFAAVFALVTGVPALHEYAADPTSGAVVGAGYGALLWLANIVVIWPLWLNAVGLPGAPPFPYLPPASLQPLVGHLVWGGLLGVLYPAFSRP
ncbi:MAG: histidine kinase [Halobacteriales archaeon]